jgi:hypothetical protein
VNCRNLWKAGAFLLVGVCLGWCRVARAECDVPVQSLRGSATPVILSRYPSQEKLNQLKIMNYYPSAHSWANMWTDWTSDELASIDNDFERIASLHANTVRIIVNVEAFGYPTPSSLMLHRLGRVVDLACKHGLQVQLTLFDWLSGYSDISGSKTWADAVVGPYKDDPRIAFVELKNEIGPEGCEATPPQCGAMAWAKEMVPYLQDKVGDIPVTLSVTSGTSGSPSVELSTLIKGLDGVRLGFLDIHQYYGSPFEDYYELSQARQIAREQGLALLVGETGTSTNAEDYTSITIPQTFKSYEAWQSYAYRSAFFASSKLGLPAPAPWVLYDFKSGTIHSKNTDPDEYEYGLYQLDGSPKLAAADVSKFFADGSVDTSFDNGFESYIGGSPSLPTLWQIDEPNPAHPSHFAIDTKEAHTGHASAKIWDSSSGANGNPSFYITPIATIEGGSKYTASVYVKLLNATGTTQICLSWFDSGFGWLGNSCSGDALSGTMGWKQISVTDTAPEKTAYVQLFLSSYDNTGTAWFDDVSFRLQQ